MKHIYKVIRKIRYVYLNKLKLTTMKIETMKLASGIDKYFLDLEEYEDNLFCRNCGNESKKTFNFNNSVRNGNVYYCRCCNTETLLTHKPNLDNY